MAEVIQFNYWLALQHVERITHQLIFDVEKIVAEHRGRMAFYPITLEDFLHERIYEFNPGMIFLRMMIKTPKYGPCELKISAEGKTHKGTALALLCGFNEDEHNYGVLFEELRMLSAKYRQ